MPQSSTLASMHGDFPKRFGLVWFDGISTIVGYLMPNPFLYIKNISISNNSVQHKNIFLVYTQLNVKTVLFQTIQLNISTQFRSIWPIDRTQSGATTQSLSGPGSDGNKVVLYILQSFSIPEALTIKLFSVISRTLVGGVLPLCRDAVSVFYRPKPMVGWFVGFYRLINLCRLFNAKSIFT